MVDFLKSIFLRERPWDNFFFQILRPKILPVPDLNVRDLVGENQPPKENLPREPTTSGFLTTGTSHHGNSRDVLQPKRTSWDFTGAARTTAISFFLYLYSLITDITYQVAPLHERYLICAAASVLGDYYDTIPGTRIIRQLNINNKNSNKKKRIILRFSLLYTSRLQKLPVSNGDDATDVSSNRNQLGINGRKTAIHAQPKYSADLLENRTTP